MFQSLVLSFKCQVGGECLLVFSIEVLHFECTLYEQRTASYGSQKSLLLSYHFCWFPSFVFLVQARLCSSACFHTWHQEWHQTLGSPSSLQSHHQEAEAAGALQVWGWGVTHRTCLKATKAPSMPMASISFSHKVYREHRKKQKREPHLSQAVPFLCNAFFLSFMENTDLLNLPCLSYDSIQ